MNFLRSNVLSVFLFFISLHFFNGCTKKSELDAIIHADQHFSFPAGFPPDPGKAGRKTIEGIDSDHDGLRDDVQRWIYARYPKDERKQKALRQMALSCQFDLQVKLNNKEEVEKALRKVAKAVACLSTVFADHSNLENIVEGEYTEAKVFNTKERTMKYIEYNYHLNGTFLGPSYPHDGTECEK